MVGDACPGADVGLRRVGFPREAKKKVLGYVWLRMGEVRAGGALIFYRLSDRLGIS